MRRYRETRGFTLIELLIVVAIIGILAAIAIPNFLQAQVRSKVAKAQADMRTIATALETYRIDGNSYPPDPSYWFYEMGGRQLAVPLFHLTTPVDHASSIPTDPFPNKTYTYNFPGKPPQYRYFAEYWKSLLRSSNPTWPETGRMWALVSSGPDHISNIGEYLIFGEQILNTRPGAGNLWGPGCIYDPTNGTVSNGDIVRVGP